MNAPLDPIELQREVGRWTRAKFPRSLSPQDRCSKLAEECGEVVGAEIKLREGRATKRHLLDEMADAHRCLMALADVLNVDLYRVTAARFRESLAGERTELGAPDRSVE